MPATTITTKGVKGTVDFIVGESTKDDRVVLSVVGNTVTGELAVTVTRLSQEETADLITVLEYYKKLAASQ